MERERETQFGSQCGRIHTQVQPGMSYRSSHSSISYTCQIITLMKVTGEPNQLTWQTVLPKLVLSHRPKRKSTNTGLAQKTQKALYNFLRIYLVLLPNSWKQTVMPKISLQDDFSHLYIRTPVNIQRIRSGYSPCLPVHAAHNRRFSMSDVCKQVGNMLHGSGQGLRLGRSMQEAGYDAKDTLQNPFLLIWLKIWQWARTAMSIFLSSSGSQAFYLSSLLVCKIALLLFLSLSLDICILPGTFQSLDVHIIDMYFNINLLCLHLLVSLASLQLYWNAILNQTVTPRLICQCDYMF